MYRATIWSSDPATGGVILHEEHYRYDAFNRRTSITVDSDGVELKHPELTNIIYDRDNAWIDLNALTEVGTRYLFGNGIDHLIGRQTPTSGTEWYIVNVLRNVVAVVGASGNLASHFTYAAYGEAVEKEFRGIKSRYRFTCREDDSDLSLMYFRARYYSPLVGRFVSQDPLRFSIPDANLYGYVENSPLNRLDPTGRNPTFLVYAALSAVFIFWPWSVRSMMLRTRRPTRIA